MKLVKTDLYLLLIEENIEVCRGQYRFLNNKVELIHEGHNYPYKGEKIIAYRPLTTEAKELDLPLLPNPFKEDEFQKSYQIVFNYVNSGIRNYEAMMELIELKKIAQSKQFSLEDIKKAFLQGCHNMSDYIEGENESKDYDIYEESDLYIQSLSTQQLPKGFIPEYIGGGEYLAGEIGGNEIWAEYPKELKTITNSEGKQEIQGRYVY